jgi:hypothetical protein
MSSLTFAGPESAAKKQPKIEAGCPSNDIPHCDPFSTFILQAIHYKNNNSV